jgi:hypothetical protein
MSMTQQTGRVQQAYGPLGGPQSDYFGAAPQPTDYRFPMPRSKGNSIGWELAGLAALGLVVLGAVYIWPDVERYIRIKNM